MSETPVWTLDFMREETLVLAGPYSPGSEPARALRTAASALQAAAEAVRRHQAARALGAPVIGYVGPNGGVHWFSGRLEA